MRIFRISNVMILLMAATFGVFLFWTSQDVQKKERELAKIKAALAQEQETIRVLSVEWDYLNRPQRLEDLAKQELGMKLPSAKEVVTAVDQIPEPVAPAMMPMMEEDGAIIHEISMNPAPAQKTAAESIPQKAKTVVPSAAEKETFYQLIEKLNRQEAAQ